MTLSDDTTSADKPTTCEYERHAEFGKPVVCGRCGGTAACGPFRHACPRCNPDEFQPCYLCGAKKIYCCC